jgi:taurine dioxygenase
VNAAGILAGLTQCGLHMSPVLRKLTPRFGAAATGIAAAHLDEVEFSALRRAWVDANGILVLKQQQLTPAEHVAFGKRFGPLYTYSGHAVAQYAHPEYPEIYRVSNKVVDGAPQGRKDAGTYWHSDQSYQEIPPSASILYAREIPPHGGDTLFADMYRAFEALAGPMQRFLESLTAVHSLANAAKTSYGKDLAGKGAAAIESATQPVVRTHAESGRKALFVNPGFTSHIVQLSKSESDAILQFLYRHSTAPEFCYRHVWEVQDVVIWDNRAVMHYAVSDYDGLGDRLMHRTTAMGEKAS